jgi:hypothetical protein
MEGRLPWQEATIDLRRHIKLCVTFWLDKAAGFVASILMVHRQVVPSFATRHWVPRQAFFIQIGLMCGLHVPGLILRHTKGSRS